MADNAHCVNSTQTDDYWYPIVNTSTIITLLIGGY